MLFRLKNDRATYQNVMDTILRQMLGINMETYVDDMVVTYTYTPIIKSTYKSCSPPFSCYQLKHNQKICVFKVKVGKFLGFLFIEHEIKTNPEKVRDIINMESSNNIKEVQRLIG